MPHRRLLPATFAALCAGLAPCLGAQGASPSGFAPGTLLLYSPLLPGAGATPPAVIAIDPLTGASQLVADIQFVNNWEDAIAYDPYRDGALFSAGFGGPVDLWLADASGNLTSLGLPNQWARGLAPTGDGRVYYRTSGSSGEVKYMDAAGQHHQLLDATGAQPFAFVPGAFFDYRVMHYHAPTRSLFAVSTNGQLDCSGVRTIAGMMLRRVTLSADGTRALGPIACALIDLSSSSEAPVGLSTLPDGDLLLVADTGFGGPIDRMLRVDPITLATRRYATNSNTTAVATRGGTYSSARDEAVILDSGADVLRAFAEGTTGGGTVLTTTLPVSGSGSAGEVASLVEVEAAPCAGFFRAYGTETPGAGGFAPAIGGTGCPTPGAVIDVHVAYVPGGAVGILLLGGSQVSVPLFGGTLLVLPQLAVPLQADGVAGVPGAGAAQLTVGLPSSPSLAGASAWLQAGFLDAGAPRGISLTSGLEIGVR